ncbi:DUF5666 domain-containing protein [candidate division KSB1 bacterium]|nr:DUF5666 domain-containing protein [candidate division KSB1 bacterium]
MSQFIGFDCLKAGQRVKVKGKPSEDSTFVAGEISIKNRADQAKIEGVIQRLDHQKNTLRIFNRDFALPGDIQVKGLQHNLIDLKELKTGDVVKLKGKYSASNGLMPEKIILKETMGFNVDELHGAIDKIDRAQKTLEVTGFTVVVNEKTAIEGF